MLEKTDDSEQQEILVNQLGPDQFFDGTYSSKELPDEFSFSSEIKFALQSFLVWAKKNYLKKVDEEHEEYYIEGIDKNEVSAVFYRDSDGSLRIQELNSGFPYMVMIAIRDFSKSSVEDVYKQLAASGHPQLRIRIKGVEQPQLSQLDVKEKPDSMEKWFWLLPRDFPVEEINKSKILGRKGECMMGSLHLHAKDMAQSPGDLAIFFSSLADPEIEIGASYSVLSGGGVLYTLVKTASFTPPFTVGDDFRKSLDEYEILVEKRTTELKKEKELIENDARLQVIIEECMQHGVAFYAGKAEDNLFKRVV